MITTTMTTAISRAAGKIALACAILAAVGLTAAGAAAAASGTSQPQHRQIGAATLSGFRVVLTATRGAGNPPSATVTAAGYRRAGDRWRLISRQRIGRAGQWFWFSVDTCSLTTTQFVNATRVSVSRSIKVSLLITPSIGCSRTISKHWPR